MKAIPRTSRAPPTPAALSKIWSHPMPVDPPQQPQSEECSPPRTVHDLVARRAAHHPEATAVIAGERRTNCRELLALATRISAPLPTAPWGRTAICLGRDERTVAALLGVAGRPLLRGPGSRAPAVPAGTHGPLRRDQRGPHHARTGPRRRGGGRPPPHRRRRPAPSRSRQPRTAPGAYRGRRGVPHLSVLVRAAEILGRNGAKTTVGCVTAEELGVRGRCCRVPGSGVQDSGFRGRRNVTRDPDFLFRGYCQFCRMKQSET